jgi:hypothetical protein
VSRQVEASPSNRRAVLQKLSVDLCPPRARHRLHPRNSRDHAQTDYRDEVHQAKRLAEPLNAADDREYDRYSGNNECGDGRLSAGSHRVSVVWDCEDALAKRFRHALQQPQSWDIAMQVYR